MGTKYSTVTVTSYNASPPADDGSQSASNQITWAKHKTKLGDPLKTAIEAIDTALVAALNESSLAKTDTYTVTAAEHAKTIEVTTASAGCDIILLDAATAAAGFWVNVLNAPNSTSNLRVKLATSTDLLQTVTAGAISVPPDASVTFKVNSAANGYNALNARNIFLNKTVAVAIDTVSVGAGVLHTLTVPDVDATLAVTTEFAHANQFTTSGRLIYPPGHIQGLVLSNHTDSDHDISITKGSCSDSTGTQNLILSSALVKQIDAAWAVGSGSGGMDTGTVSEGSWYYLHLIKRSDTGVVDALFSLSQTAPTMPSNYDYKRLIGAVLTDSSANITAFTAYEIGGGGLRTIWDDPPGDTVTVTTGARTLKVIPVPTGFRCLVGLNVQYSPSAAASIYFSCPDANDEAATTGAAPYGNLRWGLASPGGTTQGFVTIVTNTSRQIGIRATEAASAAWATLWYDLERR